MEKRRKIRRHSKRQKARRIKAYIARILVVLLALAAVAAVVFISIKLLGSVKDLFPFGNDTAAEAEENVSNSHNVIAINKDGSLTETSVEDFDTSEYDPDELTKMVNDTIAAYNGDDEKIVLKSLEVKSGIARAVIYYKTAEDYAAYNEKTFVIGKVADLDITGVTLANDKNEVLTPEEMEKVKGNYVMLNDDTAIALPKDIQYISRNVTKTGKKSAEVKKAGIDSVIIYK